MAAPPDIGRLLARTVWIDIGVGRTLSSLSPREIARLKRCKEPTMSFEKTHSGWVQTFFPGIAMRTEYASAAVETNGATITIRFFSEGRAAPAETVRLQNGGAVLVQETPGFRPHTFLKCALDSAQGKKKP